MSYKNLKSNTGEVYVGINESKAVTIISPMVGTVNLTEDALVELLNYLNGFDYHLAVKTSKKYSAAPKIGYYAENENGELVIIDIDLISTTYPDITFKTLDIETAQVKSSVKLVSDLVRQFINFLNLNGIKKTIPDITGIEYVAELPEETSAQRGVVYAYDSKYYIINEDEDDFIALTGTFEKVSNFPATTNDKAKEGILYNLTAKQEGFGPGVYTYTAATNIFTSQDLTVVTTAKLPAVDKADAKTIYVLTKDIVNPETGDVEKGKGTAWYVDKNAYVKETRPIQNVNKLPFVKVAKNGVYYIINNVIHQYSATTKKFTKIGEIKKVEALPDVTTTKVDPTVVYVLTKVYKEHEIGSKWIFNTATKEFDAYTEES